MPEPTPQPAATPARKRSLPQLPPFFDRRAVQALTLRAPQGGFLGGMRVRKKLLVLHTLFSLVLAGALVLTLRPAVLNVVREAELEQAQLLLELAREDSEFLSGASPSPAALPTQRGSTITTRRGSSRELGLGDADVVALINAGGRAVKVPETVLGPAAALFVAPTSREDQGQFVVLATSVPSARQQVTRLYVIVGVALLAIYLAVALALEALVLPQSVYRPIRRMLEADDAVQQGRTKDELIPPEAIPADELGEIMRSRNESVLKLRRQEQALASALAQLEEAANDLKRKNHLLETAQRNLADADRLASLGMLSAGIAHELNTPLSVIKGLTERLAKDPARGLPQAEADLMLRVVKRLERLSESLLDYARVRPPVLSRVDARAIVEEALTLVRLDREAKAIALANKVPEGLSLSCDGDRLVQVFVNLIRNAVDALLRDASPAALRQGVRIEASPDRRDGRDWLVLSVVDAGPGIAPEVLARLFEPFVSTRLDSKGTGLGLAVAEGIVKEHGGLLLVHNLPNRGGAVFEVHLPVDREGCAQDPKASPARPSPPTNNRP